MRKILNSLGKFFLDMSIFMLAMSNLCYELFRKRNGKRPRRTSTEED